MSEAKPEQATGGEDDRRRQALRKAGEEYFEKILASSANKGAAVPKPDLNVKRQAGIPLTPVAPGGGQSIAVPISNNYQPKGDQDFQAMGTLIERYKDLAVAVIGVSALGAAFALARGTLKYVAAPASLTSLHFVVFSLIIYILDRAHVYPFELKSLSIEAASACLPSALVHTLFVTSLFFSLGNNSVAFVLSAAAFLGEATRAILERIALGAFRDGRRFVLLAASAGGLAGCVAGQLKITLHGLLYLAILALAQLGEALLEHAGNPNSSLERVVGAAMADRIRSVHAREKAVGPSNALLLRNLLPAVPLGAIAFGLGENHTLASSNATVPLLTAALLSVFFYTFGASVVFYLNEIGTNKRHVSILVYLGFIVGVVVDAVTRQRASGYLAAAMGAISILASTLFRILSAAHK